MGLLNALIEQAKNPRLERNKAAAPPYKGRHSRFNFTV